MDNLFFILEAVRTLENKLTEKSSKEILRLFYAMSYEFFSLNSETYFQKLKDKSENSDNFGINKQSLLKLAEKTILNIKSEENLVNLIDFVIVGLKSQKVKQQDKKFDNFTEKSNVFDLLGLINNYEELNYVNFMLVNMPLMSLLKKNTSYIVSEPKISTKPDQTGNHNADKLPGQSANPCQEINFENMQQNANDSMLLNCNDSKDFNTEKDNNNIPNLCNQQKQL